MKNVLVVLPVEERHKQYLEEQVKGSSEAFRFFYKESEGLNGQDLEGMQAVIGMVPPRLIAGASKLEWLQLSWAGADRFTKPGVLGDGVVLTNASGAYGLAVSEHMVAVTFALVRKLHRYGRSQIRRQWHPLGAVTSVEGATVLVLGLGDIGGCYARKMKALGAYVIGVRRTLKEKPEHVDEQYTIDALDGLLGRADIVAMVLPGGERTEHLMDERRLRLMKKGSYLINDGRGSAIDPAALKKVLREDHLGGVALDVTEPEPLPAEDELWDDERVIITPHISGQFFLPETFERIVRIVGENLGRYARGEELTHIVDREAGY